MTSWWRHHCFSESVYKTCHRRPTELKLGKLIVHSKFHKICKFENHVTRNDVIMTSLPKQWKNADLRETKQIFEPLCQKLWVFMSNFGIFDDARSPNMAMSRDPRSKFRKNLFFPNSAFNIRKSYKISSRKALYFRSYQPKTSRGEEYTPSAFRVNTRKIS